MTKALQKLFPKAFRSSSILKEEIIALINHLIVYVKLLFEKEVEGNGTRLLASISMLSWGCHLVVLELPDKMLIIFSCLCSSMFIK